MKKNEENLPEVHKAELLPEKDLDSEISQTLVRANVTDAVIAELKNKYGGMKLKAIDDKEGYLEICEARKQTRKIGIMAEKICKAGREDAVAIQKKWLNKEKEVLGKIDEVQTPLDEEIKKFEDHEAEIEAAEKKRQEEQFMSRQTTLLKMEAKFADGSFTLGGVSYELNNIKEADEEIWNDVILAKYKKEFEKVEAVRAEAERKQQEAADDLKKQQEQLQKERDAFAEQQRIMTEQQNALNEQKRIQEDIARQEQQRKDNEAQEALRRRTNERTNQLFALGMKFNAHNMSYVYDDVSVSIETQLSSLEDAEWNALLEKITPEINDRKAAFEKSEVLRIEKEKQDAIDIALQKEKDRIAEESRLAEVKAQQEKERQAEEAAKATDKEKWASFLSLHSAITLPEFKSAIYKSKLQQYKEKMEEVNAL